MTYYWFLKDVPELNGLTRSERRRVHGACYRKVLGNRRSIIAYILIALCVRLGIQFAWKMGTPMIVLGGVIGGAVGWVICMPILIDTLRPFYAEYVKANLRKAVLSL